MSEFTPRKAEKKRVKLKMAVQGPSGSGKTWGALSLATNLWPNAKICLIDTENESASLYADNFEFETIDLRPPFTTARYEMAVKAALQAGAEVIIIDTITAQWDGDGGILRRKEEMDRRGGNSFTNWASFTPEHEHFKQLLMQTPVHFICTMRSKQEYALQQNDKGKQTPVKLGLAPVQRDGMDYEFTLVFDVQGHHMATASKDRTSLFADRAVDLAAPETAASIARWLESGKAIEPLPTQPVSGVATSTQAATTIAPKPPVSAPVAPSTPAASPIAPKYQGKFVLMPGGLLSCVADEVIAGGKPDKPWKRVVFNGNIDGITYATTFDTKFFKLLDEAKGKEIQLALTQSADKKYLNIKDILYVDGIPYEDGVAVTDSVFGKDDPDAIPA